MPAEFLLIDISNSFTKLVASSRDALAGEVVRLPTPRLTPAALRRAAGPAGRYAGIVLSSVVPAANTAVREYAATARSSQPPRLLKLGARTRLGIAIDYPQPARIGADRLANAAGAAVFYGPPAVVVDFGTAVTFDVLGGTRARPAYLGGVIAPGLEAMTHYLHQRTALLPRIVLREPEKAIGKSTLEAMRAGAVFGYRGLVREILEELRRELRAGKRLTVVATGGDAELIARRLPEIAHVHPNLTLEGLRIVAGLNFDP